MVSLMKLPSVLGAALLPFLSLPFGPDVEAENGVDTVCNVSYFQSTERDVTQGQYTTQVWWGRDGMHADCHLDFVGHQYPVVVDVFRPANGKPDYYNVAWGQSLDGRNPVFTNQHELNADNAGGAMSEEIFDTEQTFKPDQPNKDMYAFFRVQSCVRHVLGHSRCVPWNKEPYVVVELNNKVLTRHL